MRSHNSAADTVNELLAQRVDALMINLPLAASEAEQIQTLCGDKPVIFMDVEPQAQVAQCQFSNAHGAQAAVEHLIALGHRQIGLLNGPPQAIFAQSREAAWREALAAHQLTPFCVLQGDWSAQSCYQAMLQQLPDRLPQALLVANDQMALGAMRTLHQHGVAIPAQVSITRYDDTAESAWYQPPLTTVRQDLHALGEQSVRCCWRSLRIARRRSGRWSRCWCWCCVKQPLRRAAPRPIWARWRSSFRELHASCKIADVMLRQKKTTP